MAPFKLTKSHVKSSFSPLLETTNLPLRAVFFNNSVRQNITWTITGSGHALAGTRHTIQDHSEASFNRLLKLLERPIRFEIVRVIVDSEPAEKEEGGGWWASVEMVGYADRKTGGPYNNEYAMFVKYDDEGKIVEIRSYHDTALAETLLAEDEPKAEAASKV
ncbi:hypothetical protein CC79DRAFT_1328491 [Sarocladium strictum]